VQAPKTIAPIARLERGELEAIALAQELHADLILMDDRKGVTAAEQLGLPVIGALNVLKRAAVAGLLDLSESIESLKRTTFRSSQKLIDQILRDTPP
jgi:predicted nucleic acid-binding protein